MQTRDLIRELCTQYSQETIAHKLEIDPGSFSKFISGERGLTADKYDKLLCLARATIIKQTDYERLEDAFDTVTDMWKSAKRKSDGGNS